MDLTTIDSALCSALDAVPPGPWAVGVSGGADSVALLSLLRRRADISLTIVHLDHQLRGDDSTADAEFVAQLAARLQVPCVIQRLDTLERTAVKLPKNASARYRRLRLELFGRVVREQHLQGVLLAHHADDQAETVLQRLLRGSGPAGLAGMSARTRLGELLILRPLLGIRRQMLRDFLGSMMQPWREDASNASPGYQRNRLRMLLAEDGSLTEMLLELSKASAALRDWVRQTAPVLPERFQVNELADLPGLLAQASARRWLIARGVLAGEIDPSVIDRLLVMCNDAASAPRQQFPGSVAVRRRRGFVEVPSPGTPGEG